LILDRIDGVPDCIGVLDEGAKGVGVTAETAPEQPPAGGLRRVARAILWPLRRFFDPRFTGIFNNVQDVKRLLITDMEAANETATLTGRTLDRLVVQNQALLARLGAADGGSGPSADPSEESFAAAYAIRALSTVPIRASIAAVGANGSVDRSLAALGYDVTNELGLRTSHHEGKFDAVLCLSPTIEVEQLRRLRHLTKDAGLLVVGLAVGPAPVAAARRVFDQAELDDFLEGWEPQDVTLIQRRDAGSWARAEGRIADLDPKVDTVAMVTATKRPQSTR
jgi:hypothetical protein